MTKALLFLDRLAEFHIPLVEPPQGGDRSHDQDDAPMAPARPPHGWTRAWFALAVALAVAAPSPGAAQLLPPEDLEFSMRGGLGWAGTVPDALLGAAFFYMLPGRRIGLYADAKIPHDSAKRSPLFQDDLTIAEVLEEFPIERRLPAGRQDEWQIFHLGLVRPISEVAALVVGGGIAHRAVIQEYGDDGDPPLTPSGYYFVEDEAVSGWEGTLTVAAIFAGGESIAFSAGFELAPRSFSLGVFYLLR
jgi:hypothetical protein